VVAQRWRAASLLAGAFAVGILVGALFTGHPLGHLWQMLLHGYLALGRPHLSTSLVTEFQPFDGRPVFVAVVVALLAWRARRSGAQAPWRDPTVVLIAGCWALGYVASRFWFDWSLPAFLALAALEIQELLERRVEWAGRARVVFAAAAGLVLLLATVADINRRWSDPPVRPFLSADNATHRPWLPQPGGIAYSADMSIFYSLFFANPQGQWRYVLGFEPALMRDEDYAVYTAIRRSRGLTESFLPWLHRMRPEDRLYVADPSGQQPPVPGLEWFQPVFGIWAGRLPRTASGAPSRPSFVAAPLLDGAALLDGPAEGTPVPAAAAGSPSR
jgi:hypothetical protein